MPKSSKEKIEDDKESVLMELQKNSSDSVNVIAKRLGFSRQKVWRIIKDFENTNTIWGYTAVIDDEKISRKRFFVILKRSCGLPRSSGRTTGRWTRWARRPVSPWAATRTFW